MENNDKKDLPTIVAFTDGMREAIENSAKKHLPGYSFVLLGCLKSDHTEKIPLIESAIGTNLSPADAIVLVEIVGRLMKDQKSGQPSFAFIKDA